MNRTSSEAQLQWLNEDDPALAAAHAAMQRWAGTCSLRQDCEIPTSLRDRAADNWRGLVMPDDRLSDMNDVLLQGAGWHVQSDYQP
jgi:hypothetical protein